MNTINLFYEKGKSFEIECDEVIYFYLRIYPTLENTKRLIELYGLDTVTSVMSRKIESEVIKSEFIDRVINLQQKNEIIKDKIDIEKLKRLNNKEVELNNNILHYLAKINYIKALEACIIPSLEFIQTNCFGQTPLHMALKYGNVKAFEILYKNGKFLYDKKLNKPKFLNDIGCYRLTDDDFKNIKYLLDNK